MAEVVSGSPGADNACRAHSVRNIRRSYITYGTPIAAKQEQQVVVALANAGATGRENSNSRESANEQRNIRRAERILND